MGLSQLVWPSAEKKYSLPLPGSTADDHPAGSAGTVFPFAVGTAEAGAPLGYLSNPAVFFLASAVVWWREEWGVMWVVISGGWWAARKKKTARRMVHRAAHHIKKQTHTHRLRVLPFVFLAAAQQ